MKYAIHLCLFILLCLLGSCKDPCDDVNCNFGNCTEGICDCDEGYEGDNCQTEIRAKYLGTWSGPNDCNESALPVEIDMVTLVITASETGIYDIILTLELNADFTDIEIPEETTSLIGNAFETGPTESEIFGTELSVSSDGIFRSEEELSLDFVVNSNSALGQLTINCSATLAKQ